MPTELIANSPAPGTRAAITTLAADISTTNGTTITTAGAAPTVLQTSGGQFRIVIDSEVMIVTAGASGTSWTVTRGAEGSTAATHSSGASVYHYLTAGALNLLLQEAAMAYNVRTFGAVGDGTTDDSGAIQDAIDACDSNRGGNVYFPQGKYRISTGLVINYQGTVLIGEGKPGTSQAAALGSTRIISDNGITAITCNNTGSHDTLGFGFKNLHVVAASGASSGNGILVQDSEKTIIENVTCSDYVAGYGLRIDGLSGGSNNAQYSELIVYQGGNCLYGLYITGIGPNGTTLFGGYYEGNHTPIAGSVAIYVESGGEFHLFGTKVQGWATGVYLQGGASGDHELHGPRFEYCNTSLRIATNNCHLYGGSFDNTLLTGPGTPIASSIGIQLDTGADDCVLMPAKQLPAGTMFVMNGGLRPRFPGGSGATQAASTLGSVVGSQAVYSETGTLLGYAPLYDTIT